MVQNKALQLLQRREDNLRFFQKHYPDIYHHFAKLQLTRAEVVISNNEDEVDLNFDGQSLYKGQGKARAHYGVELFRRTFAKDKILPSLSPPWPGVYQHPRYAHSAVDRIARLSPLGKSEFRGYPVPNFYPLVVFQGVGLGYQIEELVTTSDVENALIVEPEEEVFGASLLTVDWERVCTRFQKTGRSLRFLIGLENTEEGLWPSLIHNLMHFTPIFPLTNLFINERGDPTMDAVAKRLNREGLASLSVWGHYDDEVRQLNNALHAFHMGIRTIPPKQSIQSDIPVLIVGSGPSLDERLEDIKAVRDEVVIVSAGSGIRVLIENDIYPDFHIELESDYYTHRVISSYDREKLKSTRLIAASQICPLTWELFGEQRLYFKSESPIGHLFGSPETLIVGGAPTCTNAAIALCSQMGLSNLFLFGTDYGFKDHQHHHSKSSVYVESENKTLGDELKKGAQKTFSKSQTFQIPGVNDSTVHTTQTYFTSKRATENLIKLSARNQSNTNFHNCADGAEIEGATWMTREDFLISAHSKADKNERLRVVAEFFNRDAQTVSLTTMTQSLDHTRQKLAKLAKKIETFLTTLRLRGKKDITRLSSEVSRYMEGTVKKEDIGFYYMIRGTVRHFLYVAYSHAMAMSDDKAIALFLNQWRDEFMVCMNGLPNHFDSVTRKKYVLEEDPWVTQSINDPENTLLDSGDQF
ncbi:motility associated factor glycosyltransferase family protein [Marinobacter persicus]|uniref:Uncharacterized protein DUF115 n=1 Tax=Marinobacter persicus TaxID=930118 RepID=A0A2S6G621_9GAMM|nr:6-hydroxymethylpterin diphosphokinase MptE-like protein [Marinobacter persicus]PPK51317.1 uncharacterized protein DUF115 [Marinobacter persicus]PPK54570.1 uncharacterized protein DUF115 [Marinobacter persicus]PPK57996.1 uncharacterized protein DUF115 [Marinobacter persicus]